MAKPTKNKSETKITRIKASDSSSAPTKDVEVIESAPVKVKKEKKQAAVINGSETSTKKPRMNPFARAWAYLKGSWAELRRVRWPDRKATWGMTGALLIFTVFFLVIILALDYGFSELFKLILGTN